MRQMVLFQLTVKNQADFPRPSSTTPLSNAQISIEPNLSGFYEPSLGATNKPK